MTSSWEKASTNTTFAKPTAPQPFAVANPQAIKGQIRGALNREYGFVKSNSAEDKSAERDRERLVELLHSLYQITADSGLLPLLTHSEVVETSTCLQRLALLGHNDHVEILSFCRRKSQDGDKTLNFGDPLQRRHLLCYASNLASNEALMAELSQLEEIIDQDDSQKLEHWFVGVNAKLDKLPKDTPAFLRRYLLNFSQDGKACIGSFAHQLAVLDIRLLGPIGWENSRCFFSLIKKFGAAKCDYLSNFLTHDELRDAIAYHQNLGNASGIEHFEFLYSCFSPQLLETAKETLFQASTRKLTDSKHSGNPPRQKNLVTEKPLKGWLRLSSWLRSAS